MSSLFHIRPPGWKPGNTAAKDGRRYGGHTPECAPQTGINFKRALPQEQLWYFLARKIVN
jgi:hypothetical protein